MSQNIFIATEAAVRQIARRNMADQEYQAFIANIRRTKIVRVGLDHITLHDYMVQHATDIANWATGYRFQDMEDKIEEKRLQAIHNIRMMFGWS